MVLKTITYWEGRKKKIIKARVCNTLLSKFSGLMFKKSSPPLLFVFNEEKNLEIHSFFCRPFRAIWLDLNKRSTKIADVKKWKLRISGKGKYLLEIPCSRRALLKNDKIARRAI